MITWFRFLEIAGDLRGRQEVVLELLVEDGFEVLGRDLIPAAVADVLRGVGGYVHLLPAGAERESREEMDRPASRALALLPAIVQDVVCLLPGFCRDDSGARQ